ncbi:hypothetical protein VTI74DRAFT_5285 [Chaetomium olivicolor]
MRLPTLFTSLLAATAHLTSASDATTRTAAIYIQPLTSPGTPPSLLAELAIPDLNPSPSETAAEVLTYEAPELPEDGEGPSTTTTPPLVRVGVYDAKSSRWTSSTSVLSAKNFAKGYAPHFELTLDPEGMEVVGVVCKGVAIDAGVTRDFGPKGVVVRISDGEQPRLGKPVVLSPEGRRVTEEGEKTFLQKYWWVLAVGAFLLLSGGGEQK